MTPKLKVFANRNFRFYWFGLLVSMIGTFVQVTAQSWLVYELTRSPLKLGLVSTAQAAPFLALSLLGGDTADRLNKRNILFFTQTVMMILAFTLGILALTGSVKVWHIALIAVGMGTANSFDIPTRQAFIYDIVGREEIMSAVSLNSSLVNLAQIAGPAIAGFMVSTVGNAWCFIFNGASFLAFIIALKNMVIQPKPRAGMEGSAFKSIIEGLRYAWTNQVLKTVILLVILSTIFIMPYGVLMPVFAGEILKVGSRGFGLLMTCTGLGALSGGLMLGSAGNVKHKGRLFFTGAFIFSIAILLFSFSRIFPLSCALLVAGGFFSMIQSSTSNTIIQVTVSDEMRGRVMGIFSLAFMGLSPLGSLQAGMVAQFFGAPFAVALGAAIFGLSVFFMFRHTSHLREI